MCFHFPPTDEVYYACERTLKLPALFCCLHFQRKYFSQATNKCLCSLFSIVRSTAAPLSSAPRPWRRLQTGTISRFVFHLPRLRARQKRVITEMHSRATYTGSRGAAVCARCQSRERCFTENRKEFHVIDGNAVQKLCCAKKIKK